MSEFVPALLTGALIAEDTEHAFHVVDRLVQMRSSFVMDVTRIKTFEDMRAASQQTNDWAAKLAEKIKADGNAAER